MKPNSLTQNILRLLFAGSLALCLTIKPAYASETERAALLQDVSKLIAPGCIPGDFAVFGDNAFVVLTGRQGKTRLPMLAATRYGIGRAVAVGHEGFFSADALSNTDNAHLARNLALWAGQKPLNGLRVGLHDQSGGLEKALAALGCRVVVLQTHDLPANLNALDVLWLNQSSLDGAGNHARIEAVQQWVRNGNGLIVDGPAWGWQMTHPGLMLPRDHSGNLLLAPMGIVFAGGMLDANSPQGYTPDAANAELTQVNRALDALEQMSDHHRLLTGPELEQVTATLGEAVAALPETQHNIVQRIETLCADKAGGVFPTHETPVTISMPFARLKAVLDAQQFHRLPPEKIMAHPSAASFPGAIPAGAKRETRIVTVDMKQPAWHGTGLYAPPGEVVTIRIPENAIKRGLSVQIGEHTDTLWHLSAWGRFPEVTMRRPLNAPEVRIASPFGGTIFIDAPFRPSAEEMPVTIANAVAAPRFVRGKTTLADWKQHLRNAPGPWAELVGNLVILSVPSSAIRDLDDPEALMAYWDEVMERCYAFYAAPKRNRPERYCVDRQISAGYMHSGYPIMTGDDVARAFCDLNILRGHEGIKCWGFYHEMGHNFQQPEWTWSAFGEVTNNLFSLYGTEMLNGVKVGAHPSMTQAEIDKRVQVIAANPGKAKYYERDPWYPLTMFWLLRQEFGWEPFTKLFAEFHNLPRNERPRTEQEKHDQFLIRFSNLTGHNLSEYLSAWGVETSPQARQLVRDLPVWMPPGMKP